MKKLAIVRIRGACNLNYKIRDTLKMLRLYKVNYCVVLEENPTLLGMLNKVKDYVAFAPVDENPSDAKFIRMPHVKNLGQLKGRSKQSSARRIKIVKGLVSKVGAKK